MPNPPVEANLRRQLGRLCALVVVLVASVAPALAAGRGPDRPYEPLSIVEAFTVTQNEMGVTVRLDFSHPRQPKKVILKDPYLVYFDFDSARLRREVTQRANLGHGLIRAVRLGQFSDQPATVRAVFEVSGREDVEATSINDGCTWLFTLGGGAGTPPAPPREPPAAKVTNLQMAENSAGRSRLEVAVGAGASARSWVLLAPRRVVIDVDSAVSSARAPEVAAGGLISDLDVRQFTNDTVRITATLRSTCAVELVGEPGTGPVVLILTGDQPQAAPRSSRGGDDGGGRGGSAAGRLVVLDAGHGGKDPGCSGYRRGLVEKDVALDIALRAERLLSARGIDVIMTRDDDTFIDLYERPRIANRNGADAFVAIHTNAMPDAMKGQRAGTELYFYTDRSSDFADVMLDAVVEAAGTRGRGTHRRAFVVVKNSTMPAVLVETGYLDNASDGALLDTEAGRAAFAQGVANGVVRFLRSLPPTGDDRPIDTGQRPEGPR